MTVAGLALARAHCRQLNGKLRADAKPFAHRAG